MNKRTPLYQKHVDLGARMVEFAGFEMPLFYSGITQEHLAVRERSGLFDVSHMGEFFIEGPECVEFLQYVTTNDVAALSPCQAQYSCMTNEQGGIVDDMIVYRFEEEQFMLVVNAANIDKDLEHLREYAHRFNVNLINASESYALLAVQGPLADTVVQKVTDCEVEAIEPFHVDFCSFGLGGDAVVSRTGYTGSGGFEIFIASEYASDLWDKLMEAGREVGLLPCGLGSRDTLRLEKGYCLYGQEIDETTTPLEAGLEWIVKFHKDFVGRQTLEKQRKDGIRRKLVGFVLQEKAIARQGFEICTLEGMPVGRVTSGTHSPSLNLPIGLGYVKIEYAKPSTIIGIKVRDKVVPAEVCKLPFL
ncbi:MAG: glycine cleavage system aminomethyltransferase GcvT [Flavobacteriales bacterium]|nr:glycine cleavage system aminomethyltransferase GcvT [Flavobacteriales bacterium]MDW8409866.1 glycine cleavage system aminomethyltransferase GcvT [Flavobacteriales bacterium]